MTRKFLTTRSKITLTISITIVLIAYLPWTDHTVVYADPNGTLPFIPEFVAATEVEPRPSVSQVTGNPIFYIEDLARFKLGPRSVAELQNGSQATIIPKEIFFWDTGLKNQLLYVPIFAPAGESIQQFSDPDSGVTFAERTLTSILDITAPDSPISSQLSVTVDDLTGQGTSAVGVVAASVISSGPWPVTSGEHKLEISLAINSATVPIYGYLSVGPPAAGENNRMSGELAFEIDSNLGSTNGSSILTIEHSKLDSGDAPVLHRLNDVSIDSIKSIDHLNTDRDTMISIFLVSGIRGSYFLDSPKITPEPEKSPEVVTRATAASQNTATRVFLLTTFLIGLAALLGLSWQNRLIARA
jgi:hypothetical protein